jgi:hypothetical protein
MWADVEEPCGYADIADIDNRLSRYTRRCLSGRRTDLTGRSDCSRTSVLRHTGIYVLTDTRTLPVRELDGPVREF